jgi:hypothetical protein
MVLQSFVGPWLLSRFLILYTFGRTHWTGDQSFARPLPTNRKTQVQNKCTHHTDVHALSGIRTYVPSVRASEDSHALDCAATVIGSDILESCKSLVRQHVLPKCQ